MPDKFKKRKGFSIGEVVIAIFVLLVGITATLTLIVRSISSSIDSRDSIVASELAQEGIELVRNVRDNILLSSGEFNEFGFSGKGCIDSVAQDGNGVPQFSGSCDGSVYLNRGSVGYNQLGKSGVKTKFFRFVNVESSGNGYLVRSYVWWGGNAPAMGANESACSIGERCVFGEAFLRKISSN